MASVPSIFPRVLVAGGGIGGLAAALALQQRGIKALVCERAPALREVGAGLLLSPNAVRVLSWLGLAEAARIRSRVIDEWRILNPQGRPLHRMQPGRAGSPALSLHRGDLQMLLQAQLDPAALRLEFEIVAHAQSADGVELVAQSGERIAGSVLVGTDGLHSQVRAGLRGEQSPRDCGYVGWRSVVSGIPPGYEGNWLTESWGEGKRFGISPLGGGRCYWYATTNQTRDAVPGPANAREELLARFRHWHAPIPELIAATPPDTILRNVIFDRPNTGRWTHERVTLLGDAAHPMTPNLGQGACTALEDAWVLAREIAMTPSWTAGLRRYEKARRPRTDLINSASHWLGSVIQLENPAAIALRDSVLRLTPEFCSRATMRPLFHFQA